MHGYAVIKHAAQASGGRVNLAVGTLYGALDRLAGEGRVTVDREETVAGRTRRYYRLTDLGRQALLAEAARMQHAAGIVIRRLATPIAGLA
jgi:PadR family transcriptional regulator, regulatory protein PadR